MFKGMKKIVHKMGQSIRKMKFIKRTLVSCTLGFAAVLVGSIVFENLYYWGGFSRGIPHRTRSGRQPVRRLQGRHRSAGRQRQGQGLEGFCGAG